MNMFGRTSQSILRWKSSRIFASFSSENSLGNFGREMASSSNLKNNNIATDESKQRADQIISSPTFRRELENVIQRQINEGDAAGFLALEQHLTKSLGGEGHRSGFIPKAVIPIDDIGNTDPPGYVKGEKELRCKLAALYRLIDHFGWSQSVYNHITLRVSDEEEHFLLNPFGLLYHEITASSLIKVDIKGNMIHPGSTVFGINIPGFVLHSAVHSARPDIKCVIHIHHPACIAVASMKCGFLPVSQEAVTLGHFSFHDFYGILVDPSERELIVKNLGPVNRQMFLKNHGLVSMGSTVEEAFTRVYHTVLACESQVRMMSAGLENLILISEEAKQRSMETARRIQEMIAAGALKQKQEGNAAVNTKSSAEVLWGIGELEFEAYMRMMDSAGYRTGHSYRLPSVKRS